MAQSGYTPILIYGSGTATNVPLAANLTSSASGTELALNYADGKLFYKDSGGVVQVLATKGAAQNSISFGTTGLTPNTATQGAVTVAGTLITSNGGTGLSSYTAGDLPYYASGTALSKLAIGTNGKILSSSGSAPQWVDLSTLGVNTFSAGTTGLTPSSATSGAITLAGTLNVSSGGTGLTSLTAGYIPYGNGTSAFSSSANLTFDGTNLTVNGLIQATGTPSNPTGTTSSFYNGSGIGPVISGYQFAIRTGGTPAESLRVDNNGNVGIGTSSPATYDGKVVVVKTSAGTETAAMSLVNSDNSANTAVSLGFSPNANIDLARITAIRTTSGGLTDLAFKTYGGSPNQLREQMRITSAGAVLVNTTSTTGSTRMVVADATGNGQIRAIHSTGLGLNINQASASGAAFIQQQDNADLGFSTNNTERMRIDSSGNVGIATTSPSTYRDSQGVVLVVGGSPNYATIQARGDGPSGYGNGVSYGGSYSTNPINGARMWIGATGGSGQRGGIIFYTKDLDDNTTQPLERVRIDSSGNFLLGTTSAVGKYNVVYSGTYGQYIQGPSGASTLEIFFSGATNVGSISTTGTVTAFNVSSDRRLKENIVPLTSGLTSILAIKPSEYNYKSDPSTKMQGFIADELQQIIPHAVTGETNAIDDKGNPIYQGVDASFLVPHLVSAIQEQQALIESLTTRLTALENK